MEGKNIINLLRELWQIHFCSLQLRHMRFDTFLPYLGKSQYSMTLIKSTKLNFGSLSLYKYFGRTFSPDINFVPGNLIFPKI